jgi:hypothetical protein
MPPDKAKAAVHSTAACRIMGGDRGGPASPKRFRSSPSTDSVAPPVLSTHDVKLTSCYARISFRSLGLVPLHRRVQIVPETPQWAYMG